MVAGVRSIAGLGLRLVTLTNGSAVVADRLLSAAGVRDQFEQLLSVEDAGAWKPAAEAYRYAARCCTVPAEQLMLVAAHPWDIDGAARVGLATAWVNRTGTMYPEFFTPPTHTINSLTELAAHLAPGEHPPAPDQGEWTPS